ncbi:acyltransferase family protein [Plebeiibacterium sediminum]|uniref:Acyltransferase family protein n=1 Tax=Plebeiibacterium sediminum TaxID=2992112 RepID=A0AAE3SEM9_9BACT|nr:acyltransferase family protein [Plebeiobacterium sediminum]MCW3786658.1 acyltransferase family protein [Plebeiobacterium sediminum]
MKKLRLPYIDQLKGLDIILVVFGHVSKFSGDNIGVCNKYISLFRMSLFFLLSGLVVSLQYQKNWTEKTKYLLKKLQVILIPFFAWGVFRELSTGNSYLDFLLDFNKDGYWFLWILFEFYIFQVLFDSLSALINIKKKIIVDLIFLLIAFIALKIGYHFISDTVNNFLGYLYWINNLPFFMAGVIIKKYDLTQKLFTSNLLFVFALAVIFGFSIYDIDFANKNMILAFFIVIIIFSFFYKLSTSHNWITDKLSYIGQSTLSIYVMHYFLIDYIHIESIMKILVESRNILAEAALLIVISSSICLVCILAEQLLKQNKYLSRIFLGKVDN